MANSNHIQKLQKGNSLFIDLDYNGLNINLGNRVPNQSRFILNGNEPNEFTLTKEFFDSIRKVSDCQRYSFYYDGERFSFNEFQYQEITKKTSPRVVIILESPHKFEYDENFYPLRPANKSTGKKLTEYLFTEVIPILINEHNLVLERNISYDILLANSIQYQTSLAWVFGNRMHTYIRDQVWTKLFPIFEHDLKKRLDSYQPDIIFNFCTIIANAEIEKWLIKLYERNFDIQLFKGYHPSSWFIKRNRMSLGRMR